MTQEIGNNSASDEGGERQYHFGWKTKDPMAIFMKNVRGKDKRPSKTFMGEKKENIVFLSFKFCCLKDIAMANDLESGMQWENKRVCHCLGKRSGSRIQ